MAKKQQTSNDFEKRYFDQMEGQFKELRKYIGDEFKDVKKRVGKLEDKVFPVQQETIQQLPPIWRDPQIIKLGTYTIIAIIILLIIYAGLKGIALPKGVSL